MMIPGPYLPHPASGQETIWEVSQDIRQGRRSCADVLDSCLTRIEESESRVRAWVRIDAEGARAQARERDADLAAGRAGGLLQGIPIGIKDIVDVAGQPTAAGSKLWAHHVATEDATIVARLRSHGAVILGKTVTTQYASFDPAVTRNPWDQERTPGGSSSGSAAAVACGMCLGAIGSQTGGSITRPASYCGVAGCKPTYGQVSLHGIVPLAASLDHAGPLARTVRDLAMLLDAIAGPDPKDPVCVLDAASPICPGLEAGLSDPLRLGRLGGLFEELADEAVHAAVDQALAAFREAGAVVTDIPLPSSFDEVLPRHRIILAVEAAAFHEHRLAQHPDDYQPCIRSLIEEGLDVQASEYARCRQHQIRLRRDMVPCFGDVDALVTPATPGPAPDASTTGDPAFNSPWSYTGLPTVSFPIGLSPDGLPLAIQLIGPHFAEVNLFRTAVWCEEVIGRTSAHA